MGMDGAERHCARIDIINLTDLVMPVRPKHGTFYDGTAALNKETLQKNRLLHPVNGRNENLAPDFQAGRPVVIRGNTVIIGKFKFGFDSNFHSFHALIQNERLLNRNREFYG